MQKELEFVLQNIAIDAKLSLFLNFGRLLFFSVFLSLPLLNITIIISIIYLFVCSFYSFYFFLLLVIFCLFVLSCLV